MVDLGPDGMRAYAEREFERSGVRQFVDLLGLLRADAQGRLTANLLGRLWEALTALSTGRGARRRSLPLDQVRVATLMDDLAWCQPGSEAKAHLSELARRGGDSMSGPL
jgi:hypothetical protein